MPVRLDYGARYDRIMHKLRYMEPSSVARERRIVKHALNAYRAYLKIHGPIRLYKPVSV